MKLTKLHINGFGRFGQEVVGPFDPGITVVYGPNEAGKSTLLEFIRTVLFGFPRQARARHYPPLSGGRHGGLIEFCDDVGETWSLTRFVGAKGGPFTLRRGAGESSSDEGTLRRLTAHATPDLFRNVYAFTLDELQSRGLLENDAVAGQIYSVGMGVARLPDFAADLRKRKEGLFRPRGSAQQLPKLLAELAEGDKRLKELGKQSVLYRDLIAKREANDAQLLEADGARRNTEGKQRQVQRLLDVWEDWETLQDCQAQLADLPDYPDLPESAVERLDSLEDQIQQASAARDELGERLREETEGAERPIPHASLLGEAKRVERIQRARGGFDESVGDLPDRQVDLQTLEAELERHLGDLGGDWNTERIARIDTMPARQQEIEAFRARWSDATDRVRDAEAAHQHEVQELTRTRAELDRVAVGLQLPVRDQVHDSTTTEIASFEDLLGARDAVEGLRRGRTGFDGSVRDLPERQAELQAMEQEFAERLRDLGQNWDEEALMNFDGSLVFRQETAQWQVRLQDCDRRIHEASTALEQSRRSEADAQRSAAAAEANLPPRPDTEEQADPDLRRRHLRIVRSRLDACLRAQDAAASLRNQLDRAKQDETGRHTASRRGRLWALVGAAVLAIAALLLTVLWRSASFDTITPVMTALVAGVSVLASAALLWSRRRRGPTQGWMARLTREGQLAEQASEAARAELEAAAVPLRMQGLPTADALDALEDEIDRQAADRRVRQDRQERLDELTRTLRQRQEQTVECRAELEAAEQAQHAAETDWRAWLRARGISGDWAPVTINELTARVDEVRARRGQVQQFRGRVRAIQDDIDEYIAESRPLAARFGVSVTEADLDGVKAAADFLIEGLERARTLNDRRTELQHRIKGQSSTADMAKETLVKARQVLSEAESDWDQWRRSRKLPDDLTPFGAGTILAKIETARGAADQVRRMHDRIGAIRTDINEFRALVVSLARDSGVPLPSADPEAVADTADALIGHAAEAQRRHTAQREAAARRDTTARDLQKQERRLTDLTKRKQDLLGRGSTNDAEEFRRRVATQGRRRELEHRRADYNRSLRRGCAADQDFDDFRTELAASDVRILQEQERGLTDCLASIDEEQARLREERGGLDTELAQMETETESSRLRLERSLLMERLREAADEWSKLALADLMLTATRRKFEEDRQPTVIRHAERCFREITDDRYDRLYAPIGEQTVEVREAASGATKGPEQLSRGTREQLYLALRFGLIREFSEHGERLPVIVDEALINFDPDRARRAAAAFATLAQTNQVIVFTCHAIMRDLFASEGATVLDIGSTSA